MKVLCLHGYAQTGPAFSKKCAEISKMFSKMGIETVFANGPITVNAIDGEYASDSLKGHREMRSWWTVAKSDPQRFRMETALKSLEGVVSAHGPFIGILGFSQGAALAGALAGNMDMLFPGHPPLKFAIFCSGFRLSLPEYQKYYKRPLSIPTCHIIGEYDTIVTENVSKTLYDVCDTTQRILIKHPGAHFVPSSPQVIEELASFVKHSLV